MKFHENHEKIFLKNSVWRSGRSAKKIIDFLHFFCFFYLSINFIFNKLYCIIIITTYKNK
jgi:hypothetical protein